MIDEIIDVEKEILEEIVEARASIREDREVFPSGLDKEALIDWTLRNSKFSKYFTTLEEAEKLADKANLILNKASVNETFDAQLVSEGKTNAERIKDAEVIGDKLGIIQHELARRLSDELDAYLDSYPSMKVAQKLVMVADDMRCVKDIIMDPITFGLIIRHRFILDLKIFVS